MDQSTHEVRRKQWLSIITECQARPEGTTVREWLSENNIKEINPDWGTGKSLLLLVTKVS